MSVPVHAPTAQTHAPASGLCEWVLQERLLLFAILVLAVERVLTWAAVLHDDPDYQKSLNAQWMSHYAGMAPVGARRQQQQPQRRQEVPAGTAPQRRDTPQPAGDAASSPEHRTAPAVSTVPLGRQQQQVTHTPAPAPPARLLDAGEVARHSVRSDLWLVLNGKAFDATAFCAEHPGGAAALERHAGRDATEAFLRVPSHTSAVRRHDMSRTLRSMADTPTHYARESARQPDPFSRSEALFLSMGCGASAVEDAPTPLQSSDDIESMLYDVTSLMMMNPQTPPKNCAPTSMGSMSISATELSAPRFKPKKCGTRVMGTGLPSIHVSPPSSCILGVSVSHLRSLSLGSGSSTPLESEDSFESLG